MIARVLILCLVSVLVLLLCANCVNYGNDGRFAIVEMEPGYVIYCDTVTGSMYISFTQGGVKELSTKCEIKEQKDE